MAVLSWKTIKKKFEKNLLLQNFVLRLKSDHDLSVSSSQKCLRFITSALNMKQIVSNDIIMKNGQIDHIKNFYIGDDGKFELEIKDDKRTKRSYVESKPFTFLGYKWQEYLRNLENI